MRGQYYGRCRSHFPAHADAWQLDEVVPAFLEQHYVGRPVPPTIIVSTKAENDALADVLSDPPKRASMGRAARAAAERFALPRVVERYEALFEHLAA